MSLNIIWILFFIVIIAPMVLAFNYRLIKKSNIEPKDRLKKLLIPFSMISVEKNTINGSDKAFLTIILILIIIWIVVPFLVPLS